MPSPPDAVRQTYVNGGSSATRNRPMARIDPTAILPAVSLGDDLDIRLADLIVLLLVLAFFLVTLAAVLRRLAVI